MSPDRALDPTTLAELHRLAADAGNAEFLPQLVGIFLSNAPVRFATIHEAVAAGDGATLESTAHTLRSNCSMLGALKMADYCRQWENLASAARFDEAAALLPEAEAEFAAVVAEVEALASTS